METLSRFYDFIIILSHLLAVGLGALLHKQFRTFFRAKLFLHGRGHRYELKLKGYKNEDLSHLFESLELINDENINIKRRIRGDISNTAKDLQKDLLKLIGEDGMQDKVVAVHTPDINNLSLVRISPKKSFKVKANFEMVGRRRPMTYDFADINGETIYDD